VVPVAVIALALSRYDHAGVCKFGKMGLRSIHSHLESRGRSDRQQSRTARLEQCYQRKRRQRGRDNNFEKRETGIATAGSAIGARAVAGNLNAHRQCSRDR
jgi:hypothetical protein